MDSTRFAHLNGAFARKQTRRGALRLLGLAIAGGAGLHALTGSPTAVDAAGKHRRGGDVTAESLVSQHEFVVLCKKGGGVPTRVSTHVVKCTFGPGDTSTCNFDTGTCKDVYGLDLPADANPWDAGTVNGGGDLGPVAEPVTTTPDPLPSPDAAPDGGSIAAASTSSSQQHHKRGKHGKGHKR